MHDYEVEEDGEDVGAWVAVCNGFLVWTGRGSPGWGADAGLDCRVYLCGVGFGVGAEELRVELGEDVANAVCFVSKLNAEEGFEEVEKSWCYF